jgi:hypothetical protein
MISERLLSIIKKLSPFVFFFQVLPPVLQTHPKPILETANSCFVCRGGGCSRER